MQGALFGVFGNTGQICMHIERIYLPDSLYDEFRTKFVAAAEGLRIARDVRLRAGARLAGLASTTATGLPSHVEDAVAKGATVVTGGKARPDLGPAFFEPTDPRGRHQGHARRRRARRSVRWSRCTATRTGRRGGRRSPTTPTTASTPRSGARTSRPRREVARRIESGNVNVNDILADGVRLEGHAVRRREAVRRRRAARRPGPAEVHRRAEPRRAQEAGDGRPARPGLQRLRQADARRR